MDSRPPIFTGRNLVLTIALAALLVAGGTATGIIARGRVRAAEVEARQLAGRLEAWVAQQALFQRPDARERGAWEDEWNALLAWVHPAADDSDLTARIAEVFGSSAARNLQIELATREEASGGDDSAPTRLDAPDRDDAILIERRGVSVSFTARYEDLLEVLRLFEYGQVPARIETLDVKRDFPGVAVRMQLSWFDRRTLS